MKLSKYFSREKKPNTGLMAVEWMASGYLAITTLLIIVMYTRLENGPAMLLGRAQFVAITAGAIVVYRLWPCYVTKFLRVLAQGAMLSWWYPDTYEFNRHFPNLDHVFANIEQQVFGCQPALLFSEWIGGQAISFTDCMFSELMHLGYWSYYPLILVVVAYYFFCRPKQFNRAAFVAIGSFFIYYIMYIAIPVTGPQYYFPAVGIEAIRHGQFPDVGDYFCQLRDAMPSPGWRDGFFYQLVLDAHNAGERPTAAFPSSHVGVSTILLILAMLARSKRLVLFMLPLYILLCLSTVYIRAHYAIDVVGGWVSAVIIFSVLWLVSRKV